MPIEMTAEIGTILASVGAFIVAVIGAVTALYKVHARVAAAAAAEDRKQIKKLINAIVTVPSANGDGGPTNGRTKLLVEQTHDMSAKMSEAFRDNAEATKDLSKSMAAQTDMVREQGIDIKAMSEQMGRMNRNDKSRIALFKQILERERVVCPNAELVESQKGHAL